MESRLEKIFSNQNFYSKFLFFLFQIPNFSPSLLYCISVGEESRLEKIFSNRDSIRKAREAFLIQKGRTIDPDGLNIREETY